MDRWLRPHDAHSTQFFANRNQTSGRYDPNWLRSPYLFRNLLLPSGCFKPRTVPVAPAGLAQTAEARPTTPESIKPCDYFLSSLPHGTLTTSSISAKYFMQLVLESESRVGFSFCAPLA